MRIIFMGKNKPSVIMALEYLIEKKAEIVAVVGPEEQHSGGKTLAGVAKKNKIRAIKADDIYGEINELKDIDLVISYLFWKKIKQPLISLWKNRLH